MTTDQIHKYFGTVKKALAALPTKKPLRRDAFYKWKQTGVPLLRQYQFEEVTQGKLKADRDCA